MIVEFKIPAPENFYDINGGTVVNAVCDYASFKSKSTVDKNLLDKYSLKLNGEIIESYGKSAHGSRPELGVNAIKPILEFMRDCGEDLSGVIDFLFNDKGRLKDIKTEQGNVTFSPDLIKEKDGFVYITCDCRFPHPVSEKTLTDIFDGFGSEYKATVKHDTQYVEKDGFLVRTLLSAYSEITGEKAKPIAQGGSTFARVFKKGVAFGPEFPNSPSTIHEPNERVSEKDLKKIYGIYKTAIFLLAKGE